MTMLSSDESAPMTVRRIEIGSHEFVVENYSISCKGIGVNKAIESDQFVAGGYRWTTRFYPEGLAHNDGYASLFISLKSETIEPVDFLCELSFLDQSGEGDHRYMTSFEWKNYFKLVQSLKSTLMHGSARFISRAILESPSKGYLKDDCLKIRVTIGVFKHHRIQHQHPHRPHPLLGAIFRILLEPNQWADEFVFIQVADQRFCAGKSILAARCPALVSRLPDAHQLQDIVIPDMEPQIFKDVLWFIYKDTLDEEDQEALSASSPFDLNSFAAKMLAAANQFELKILKEICESRILEKVSVESVGYLLHLSDKCHAAKLKSACLGFAAKNHAAIMESDGCKYIKETCPLLFLELAGLKANTSTKDDPSISIEGVFNLCNKVLSTFKESMDCTRTRIVTGAPYKKLKMKEA